MGQQTMEKIQKRLHENLNNFTRPSTVGGNALCRKFPSLLASLVLSIKEDTGIDLLESLSEEGS